MSLLLLRIDFHFCWNLNHFMLYFLLHFYFLFFFQRIEPESIDQLESFDQAAFLMVVDGVCSTSHTRRIFLNLGTVRLCWVFVHKTVSVGKLWHSFTFQWTTVLESQPNTFSIYNIHKWWPTLQSTPNLRSPWDNLYVAAQNELSIMCNVLCEPSLHIHPAIMLDYRCITQSTSQSTWTGKRAYIVSKMYKNYHETTLPLWIQIMPY